MSCEELNEQNELDNDEQEEYDKRAIIMEWLTDVLKVFKNKKNPTLSRLTWLI